MKTSRLIILLSVVMGKALLAQDTIRFLDGTREIVKVEEVSSQTLKYRRSDNLTGPLFSVPANRVQMVVYQNGTRDIFNVKRPETRTEPAPVYTSTSPNQAAAPAQPPAPASTHLKYAGPRVGCTYITPGTISKWITDQGKRPFLSQFGWQFESRVFTSAKGITGLAEFVPLIAGLEQNMFLPSANVLFGVRGRDGFEVAVGPNISLTGFGMVFAMGTSFHIDDVYFPVNLAFVPSITTSTNGVNYNGQRFSYSEHTGHRITLLVGFNTRKK